MKKKLALIMLLLFTTVIFVFSGCFGGDSTIYSITSKYSSNGTFTCSHTEARADTDITISCTPDEGYRFDYVSINGRIGYSTSFDMPKENTTIEVFFAPIEYQIDYVLGENTFFSSPQRRTYTVEDNAITLPSPIRYGYTFTGWYKDEGLTQSITQIDAHSTGNISLYPTFTLNTNTITYHIDGETTNVDNPNSYTFEDSTIILNNPIKTGYEFLGWYTNDSFSGNPITQIVSGSYNNYNLYPKFVCTKRDENGFRLIETALDFQIIFIENYDLDDKYKLCTDIDLGGKAWSPKLFRGEFDGGNHTISNYIISTFSSSNDGYGFFSSLDNAVVKNLKVQFSIDKSFNEPVTYIRPVAGIAGTVANNSRNTIENCQVLTGSSITLSTNSGLAIGGIIGSANNRTTITRCYVKDLSINVTASKNTVMVGGISGRNGIITRSRVVLDNCDFVVNNNSSSGNGVYIAGIMAVGENSSVTNCYFNQKTTSKFKITQQGSLTDNRIAGLFANSIINCSVANSYAVINEFQFEKMAITKDATIIMAGICTSETPVNCFVAAADTAYMYTTLVDGNFYLPYKDSNNTYYICYASITEPNNSYAEGGDIFVSTEIYTATNIHDYNRDNRKSLLALYTMFTDTWDTTIWGFSQSNYPFLK
ncbi:MAG: hypothetical protein E7362_01730 [Clostridiales bacterium]|nr:hypothetical protein [Clostridiales bacterium]